VFPPCIANISLMTVGATSGGGVAAFVFRKFYRSSKQIKAEDNQNETKEVEEKRTRRIPPESGSPEGGRLHASNCS